MSSSAELFTDGGARGNPGPAGIGAALYQAGKEVAFVSHYIGETTNNDAEYQALIAGLECALKEGVFNLVCYLDSLLIVEQLNGRYKVKQEHLQQRFREVMRLVDKFKHISFNHIPREKNTRADQLVNMAIDAEDV